jgi:hypothetical protein
MGILAFSPALLFLCHQEVTDFAPLRTFHQEQCGQPTMDYNL